jgi:uncharacterized protein
MPSQLSYPGVYIEEIPSGVRTITGVATSITAFVGRTGWGPIDTAMLINSFGDFERQFGGLRLDSPLSYAVRDFYLNGGQQAVIVRLYLLPSSLAPGASADGITKFMIPGGGTSGGSSSSSGGGGGGGGGGGSALLLQAASAGDWGNKLILRATYDGIPPASDTSFYAGLGVSFGDLFNLIVQYGIAGPQEQFRNLSIVDSPRRVDRVLAQQSQYLRVQTQSDGVTPNLPSSSIAGSLSTSFVTLVDNPPVWSATPGLVTAGTPSAPLDLVTYEGSAAPPKTGINALDGADLFNLLCIPPDTRGGDLPNGLVPTAVSYCVRRRAMMIVDPPSSWTRAPDPADSTNGVSSIGVNGTDARNAAVYFPRVYEADPLRQGQTDTFVPCGIVAGVMARTDTQRGVWKAPAGVDAGMSGIQGLTVNLTDLENGVLNQLGVNCFRSMPVSGRVVWGARTMRGADALADDYKYVPVRRLALYIEESLYRGTQWVVFEPNDEPLWAQIRLNVGAFMQNLFRQGAFQGSTPKDAYFVKCDKETTTQNDINLGVVNIVVGFAPLKPAEFVVIQLQQLAGQIAT